MLRFLLTRILAAGLLTLALVSAPASAEDPRQILVNSLDPRVKEYVGEQVTETTNQGRKRIQRQTVSRSGKSLRIDFLDSGQVLFDDGGQSLFYYPRARIVERGPSRMDPKKIAQNQRMLRRPAVAVDTHADEQVAGRDAYVISVRPPKGPTRKVWVDKSTYVQLRQELSQPGGRAVSTYFTKIEYTAPAPSLMAFVPPVDAVEVPIGRGRPVPPPMAARIAGGWGGLLKPGYVPPRFRFLGFWHHEFKGEPGLVAVYAGPGRRKNLSIFQSRVRGMAAMDGKGGSDLRVLSTSRGDADVTVVGPLAHDELQRVMDSIAP